MRAMACDVWHMPQPLGWAASKVTLEPNPPVAAEELAATEQQQV